MSKQNRSFFIAELKLIILQSNFTETHNFINYIAKTKNLLRCYTQNIDCLEHMYSEFQNSRLLIKLHGDLNTLKCTVCSEKVNFDR